MLRAEETVVSKHRPGPEDAHRVVGRVGGGRWGWEPIGKTYSTAVANALKGKGMCTC